MIVLDTHAWIWWASDPRKLSAPAHRAIEAADSVGVCAISCWELAMLVAKRRLELDRDALTWVKQALALPRVELVPLSPEIAVAATGLKGRFHGDPADRIIIATALDAKCGVVTKDRRIRRYGGVSSTW